ncbi:MAG TPA: redoxin domain-containing protein [Methanoregula sp.]|nr:redoxin domain-containing protein [Methanoregula sp.]
MNQPPIVRPGDPAKNFSLKDQNDTTFDLYENMENWTLLSFHPLAWTAFCAGQMQSLEDNREVLSALSTSAVGISVDAVPCKKAWAESLGITHTPLLCDFWPHGAVAHQYGLFREANGFSERANVIIDENQNIVFVKVYPVHTVPDIGEVISFIKTEKDCEKTE